MDLVPNGNLPDSGRRRTKVVSLFIACFDAFWLPIAKRLLQRDYFQETISKKLFIINWFF